MEPTTEPAIVSLFKRTFARLTPETTMPIAALYSDDVVFEDPLHKLVGAEELSAYFTQLNRRVVFAEFVFDSQVIETSKAALTWTMTVQIKSPRQTIIVPGVSVLHFTDRITHHRDYFDVGAMMYERLPLIGWVLRALKKRIT
jgi:limonene-1,2-epoxide hydrolase